jgi:hypothetical protein
LLVGGLSLIVVGFVVFVMARHASPSDPIATAAALTLESETATPPNLPHTLPANHTKPRPTQLDVATACALTQRYLGGPVFSASGELLGFRVVSCRGPIRVAKNQAELVDVSVRAGPSTLEQKVNVCFEHRTTWFVASAGSGNCRSVFAR